MTHRRIPAAAHRDPAPALLALAAVAALLVFVLYLLAVRTAGGQRLDNDALIGALVTEGRPVTAFESLIRVVGVPALLLGSAALTMVGYRRGGLRLAAVVAATLVGANATAQALKSLLDRTELVWGPLHEQSLPSGHATIAMSLACALLLVLPPRERPFVTLLLIPVVAAVGVGVVAAAWHRPSDSIAAWLVATAWAAGTAGAAARGLAPGGLAARPAPWTGARRALAGALLGGGTLAASWLALETLAARTVEGTHVGLYHLAGSIAIGLAGAALLTLLSYLLRAVDLAGPPAPSAGARAPYVAGPSVRRLTRDADAVPPA